MPTSHRDRIRASLDARYFEAQYLWVQMLSEHLADCSRAFKGDLQAMVVLAIIGQATLFRLVQRGHRVDDPDPVLDGIAITASALSEVLGIPRETVRRKLEWLGQQGWIEKNPDASWQIAVTGNEATARRHLLELDQRGMDRLASLVARIDALAHPE
jgi:hypothetical protein